MKENPKEMPIFAEKKGDAIDLFFDTWSKLS
jgi:hypothetical protein